MLFFRTPRYRNDPGSGGLAELNPRGAQSAGGGVDDHVSPAWRRPLLNRARWEV